VFNRSLHRVGVGYANLALRRDLRNLGRFYISVTLRRFIMVTFAIFLLHFRDTSPLGSGIIPQKKF